MCFTRVLEKKIDMSKGREVMIQFITEGQHCWLHIGLGLGQSRKQDGVRADSIILPWEELSNMEMEGRHFAMSERADGKQKGENKQTSWETGRRGWLSKDREIGSWKKDAWEQLVIFLQSTANLPSFLAMRVPPGCKMLSVLWDFGNGIGLSTWAIILFGRGHSPPKSYCSPVGFLKK